MQFSSLHHPCELSSVINRHFESSILPILHLYTDGGPDHRLTYIIFFDQLVFEARL